MGSHRKVLDVTNLWSRARRVAPVLLVASALMATPAAQAAQPPGSVSILAEHGFGDRQNSYAWAMAWFKGKLYVGTGRNVYCVENATFQYYFQFQSIYTVNPAPNVYCARSRYSLDLRAEIWQYTPQTGKWRMVYRSPADIRNPRARGKFVARDIAYRNMTVVRDRHGRRALFISGVTANEYLPELARRHPPRLLRTYDGRHFHDISVPLIVRRSGTFPDRRPIGYRGLQVWNKRVYVVASTALTGDGAVFEVRDPFARKARFTQVTPRGMHVFELQTFDGHLYLGTGSFDTGYGVYRTPSARAPRRVPWRLKPVVTDGAGTGPRMVSVVSMHPFRGFLYVGAASWYNEAADELPAAEAIRIGHRGQWEVVTGDPRQGPDGKWRYPISGLPAGFGNIFNSHLWRMTDEGGTLYVGTNDWSWLLLDTKDWAGQYAGLVDAVLKPEFGFDLWKSCDGVNWSLVTRNAFGRDPEDFGARTLVPTHDGVYLGTANHAFGTRIWQGRGLSSCASQRARSARVAQAPRNLLTDTQRGGTVVSWEPSPRAVRYRVQRAQYVDAQVSLLPPPRAPGSFPSENALPQPVPAGTPGSVSEKAAVLGEFTRVGTTIRPVFVDRTREPGVRAAYRVVAETPSGRFSAPSNVQVVPDPRPAATFRQLQRAAAGSLAVARIAHAQRRGDRRSLAYLTRLAHTAQNVDVRQLAFRLERRLRYGNLAAARKKGG
jgi:hypothetical protein